MDAPTMQFESGVGAWYKPSLDVVNVPPIKDFKQVGEYYTDSVPMSLYTARTCKRIE